MKKTFFHQSYSFKKQSVEIPRLSCIQIKNHFPQFFLESRKIVFLVQILQLNEQGDLHSTRLAQRFAYRNTYFTLFYACHGIQKKILIYFGTKKKINKNQLSYQYTVFQKQNIFFISKMNTNRLKVAKIFQLKFIH